MLDKCLQPGMALNTKVLVWMQTAPRLLCLSAWSLAGGAVLGGCEPSGSGADC